MEIIIFHTQNKSMPFFMYMNKMFFFTITKGQLTHHTRSKKETMWKKNYFRYKKSQVNVASQILVW